MGTGTKIGLVLILVLAVVLIANLLDREVDRAPSASEQITGRIASRGLRPAVDQRTPRIVTETRKTPEDLNEKNSGDSSSQSAQNPAPTREPALPPKTDGIVEGTEKTDKVSTPVVQENSEDFGQPVPSVARTDFGEANPALGVIGGNGERRSINSGGPSNFPTVPGFPKIHTIVDGDSLWQIAEVYYSRGHLYRQILDANPSLGSGELLTVGTSIQIPALQSSAVPSSSVTAQPAASRSVEPGSKRYRIRKGDTLYEIAEALLGDGLRWGEIKRLNPSLNAGNLRIGQVITVPAAN